MKSRQSLLVPGLLALAMALAATWVMIEGRGIGIHGDEVLYVDHLVNRHGVVAPLSGVEYFFAPHNAHLVLLGRVIFAALWGVFGTGHWWILRAFEELGILVCVGLFYLLVKRRTSPWLALAFSISLLFLGYAQEVFLWPFDLHTVYSLALGLGALLALEREDRKGDIAACAMLVGAVLLIEVGIAFAVGVGVGVLLRSDRWKRLWIAVVPGLVYAVWWVWARRFGQSELKLSNAHLVPETIAKGISSVAGSVTGLNPTSAPPEFTTVTTAGEIIAALAVIALVWRFRRGGVPTTLWVTLATLVAYWLSIALGARGADGSRYVFVETLLVLLIAADALRDMRVNKWAIVVVFLVVAFALRPNLIKMHHGADQTRAMTNSDAAEYAMMELAGPHLGGLFQPSLEPQVQAAGGAVDAQLNWSQYQEVLGRYGSLAASLHSVETAAEPIPAIADATLVTGYALNLLPAQTPTDESACSEVAEASPTKPVYFELPPGGARLLATGGEGVEVAVSRFARGAASVPVNSLYPGVWAKLVIPRDSSKAPWNAVVTGPVEICPLSGAPASK